jgi:hypothetical protein
MHEYHMTHLASERRREELASAQRARLARAAARPSVTGKSARSSRAWRIGLDLLLRRSPARGIRRSQRPSSQIGPL